MEEEAIINEKIDFLQSEEWRKFQENTGKRTFHVESNGFWVNIIEHTLPVIGRYFYIPRGSISQEIVDLAKKEKAGWIRFEPKSVENLNIRPRRTRLKIWKAPYDMQPKEIFVIDIAKSEEELLNEMKQKTRYNLKLAEKKGVKIFITNEEKYINEFLRLVSATAQRKGIKFHPENYYRKMIEIIPENILKLYCAEYNGKIVAANLVVFYGKIAIYLHGATDDEYRNVMAPYLLQWQAILDAKKAGCEKYDFGGIKITENNNSWSGITKFKLGFSQAAKPVEFLGSYDIIINPFRYGLYRLIQKIKSILK
jgi:lipid II:glycine glycyltransferase (peptidoglycan interpeptide bridge formation enzyme)